MLNMKVWKGVSRQERERFGRWFHDFESAKIWRYKKVWHGRLAQLVGIGRVPAWSRLLSICLQRKIFSCIFCLHFLSVFVLKIFQFFSIFFLFCSQFAVWEGNCGDSWFVFVLHLPACFLCKTSSEMIYRLFHINKTFWGWDRNALGWDPTFNHLLSTCLLAFFSVLLWYQRRT